jgi:hypothetical protein
MKQTFNELPAWARAVIILVILVIAYYLLKSTISFLSGLGKKAEAQGAIIQHQTQGEAASYSDLQYKVQADKLYNAMKGWGTDEPAVFAVFQWLQNNIDFLKLQNAFGVRDGWDMYRWVKGDLTSSELTQVNNILYAKGIIYSF